MFSPEQLACGFLDDIMEMFDEELSFAIEPWGEVKILQDEKNQLNGNEIISMIGEQALVIEMQPIIDMLLRSEAEMTISDYLLFLNIRKNYDFWISNSPSLTVLPNPFATAISLVKDIEGTIIAIRKNHDIAISDTRTHA